MATRKRLKASQQLTMYDANEQSIVFQNTYPVRYLHWHREMQVVLVQKGQGTVIIGSHIQPFSAGDIYIIGSNQPHLFKSANSRQRSIQLLCLFIDHAKTLSNVPRQIPEMEIVVNFLKMADNGLQVPRQYAKVVETEMINARSKTGIHRFINFLKLISILVQINTLYDWKPLSSLLSTYSTDVSGRLSLIYQYTLEHYMNEISLEEIASVACMTPNAFCNYFKKYTRKTYFEFLTDLRISIACKKLLSGDYTTISMVAYATGFSSMVTFNRVFKKAMKMTPTNYAERFMIRNKAVIPFSPGAFF